MTLRLSRTRLEDVQGAIRLLASPMEHRSVDAWRSAVNNRMKTLLAADSAGFLLPLAGGVPLYSEDHDPAELNRYTDLHPPALSDGQSLWERVINLRVATIVTAYTKDVGRYWGSAYYNEYARPNGAAQTLAAMVPLGGPDPRSLASVQLWRNAANQRPFTSGDLGILQLLFPALQAGVENLVRLGQDAAELLRTCDALGSALLICDSNCCIVHQTPALERLLALDPQAHVLRLELKRITSSLARIAVAPKPSTSAEGNSVREDTRTTTAQYVIRGSLMRSPLAGGSWLLVAVERMTRTRRTAEELQVAFALTPAECRVTQLLAEGRSNSEIALALGIRGATARRHTEKIFMKLNVRSRAEAAARL